MAEHEDSLREYMQKQQQLRMYRIIIECGKDGCEMIFNEHENCSMTPTSRKDTDPPIFSASLGPFLASVHSIPLSLLTATYCPLSS